MPRARSQPSTPRRARRAVLRGANQEQVGGVVLELRAKSQRQKADAYESTIGLLRAAAADPHLVAAAEAIDALTATDPSTGGRPRKYPTWAMELFKRSISIFGSASAAQRNLADPDLWTIVCREVAPNLPDGALLPPHAPNRSHYQYYARRLAPYSDALRAIFAELSARRAREVGLADPDTARLARPDRMHVLGQDGKVFSSPVGTRATEVVDKVTGEARAPRRDPARGPHHEGGTSAIQWGTKVAFSSLRAPEPGIRVIVDLQHVGHDKSDKRGEAGAFVDMTHRASAALPGITHTVVDGAMRGVHIAEVQTRDGVLVVSPARRRQQARGGVKIEGTYHHAKQLPASKARTREFANCAGHDLSAAGGIHERIIAVDGTEAWSPVERGQIRRERKADGTYAFYADHTLPCHHTGEIHTWWEPLTPVAADEGAGFNRCEYLRALPRDDDDYLRTYGMRADTESFHAQLEYKFHKQRIPAYGAHRQLMVITGAAEVQNSWALYRFRQEHERQQAPPERAA